MTPNLTNEHLARIVACVEQDSGPLSERTEFVVACIVVIGLALRGQRDFDSSASRRSDFKTRLQTQIEALKKARDELQTASQTCLGDMNFQAVIADIEEQLEHSQFVLSHISKPGRKKRTALQSNLWRGCAFIWENHLDRNVAATAGGPFCRFVEAMSALFPDGLGFTENGVKQFVRERNKVRQTVEDFHRRRRGEIETGIAVD